MTLSSGTRLGPYEVLAPAGSGGMGEVYRAKDTRLDREVALKILPASLSRSAAFRARFEREARVVSTLSHPNICTLFDIGRENEIDYLVMEYLEGESLADRLTRGPLPVDQVVRYGVQIADALDQAHRRGVVHRDLKPGNVMLTKSGAKLLDFGLAKGTQQSDAQNSILTGLQTAQRPLTEEGTIVGTFQYMAPEQLEGKDADARTDIFAFGALLYEMATGKRAFEGKTRASLIASILDREPAPISSLQPLTPPALERVVKICLSKDPDDRWQTAHDVKLELAWIAEAGSQAGVPAAVAGRRKHREVLTAAVAAALLIATAAFAVLWLRGRPKPQPRIVSSVALPPGYAFNSVHGPMTLSPDGRQLVFVARGPDGKLLLYLRSLNSDAIRPLDGTENAGTPFWSPDSKSIGFFARSKLWRLDASGGAPELIAENAVGGGAWGRDGTIIYGAVTFKLMRVAAVGGTPARLTGDRDPSPVEAWPTLLPDGKHVLFARQQVRGDADMQIMLASIDGKTPPRPLFIATSNTVWVDPDTILFAREGDIRAQRFDMKRLALAGESFRIASDVQFDAAISCGLFTATPGMLLYQTGGGATKSQLIFVDRSGKQMQAVGEVASYYTPRLSHDGRRVAVDMSDPRTDAGDIWIFDLARNLPTRLTYDPANESSPIWTPDDRRITFFRANSSSGSQLFWRSASGTGSDEKIPTGDAPAARVPLSWSPDGRLLLFQVSHRPNIDIWLWDSATRKASPWLATPFVEFDPIFSPDGKWIAYASNESGSSEVYVQAYPDSGEKVRVSNGGGLSPKWRGDGRELYYVTLDRKIMAVDVAPGEHLETGEPHMLFESRIHAGARHFDVTADGQRFLINQTIGEETAQPLTLVQNWRESVEEK